MPCFAAASVGVKPGDWVKYQGSISGLPAGESYGLDYIDDIEWMKAEVHSVSGNTVTLTMTMHSKNGSESVQTISGDVLSGSGDLTFLIMPAGLEKGDVLPSSMFDLGQAGMTVNAVESRSYLGASRSVSAVTMSVSESYADVDFHAYWDKATGFLMELEMSMSMAIQGFSQDMNVSIHAVETNMWSGGLLGSGSGVLGDNLIYVVGIVAVVVAVVSAVMLMRVLRRRPAMAPMIAPTPVQGTP